MLANYNVVSVSGKWIEFLIPVTILVAALYNLFTSGKKNRSEKVGLFYVITVFFGLIHGFGFASYYKMINSGNEILPLLEFALGVELAQIIVVTAVLILSFIFQTVFRFNKRDWVLVVSSLVIGVFLHISTIILFESSENHKFNLQKFLAILAGILVTMATLG